MLQRFKLLPMHYGLARQLVQQLVRQLGTLELVVVARADIPWLLSFQIKELAPARRVIT
jgi:hypothetical protein